MKYSKSETVKRWLFFLLGLFIMALGVSFSIRADLGTSPISSVPYVVSLITPLSVGNATIIMHCVFILLQILILRKRYQWIQLLQLPVAFAFGYMIDFWDFVLRNLNYGNYLVQWAFCLLGVLFVAIGVSMEVTAGVVVLAGEGVVLAICEVAPIKFPTMKVLFDIFLVAVAVALSFVFLHSLQGVREGTVAAALLVGFVSKPFIKLEHHISFSKGSYGKEKSAKTGEEKE